MNKQIDNIRKTRLIILELINDLSPEQLNQIPEGFNNNIIWNLGHLIAAQEGVFYLRGGLPLNLDQKFFDSFKNGSRPDHEFSTEEIESIKTLLITSLERVDADLKIDAFNNYQSWKTRFNVEISSIEDALNFIPFHEGLHIGCMMAYKKMII
ncbi:DinB superfamily protein [Daejeonella rubra]|uniref:DinB superfamily protein n=1 Tax=Daejeonella rubra TaxID=990371 RepID=A0A1G9X7C3_9SPHI|nr:DinB family protein [Daejeonella rubra]SDM92441.1 DinB superfamily protein [Daejeonella rubra]